MQNIGFQEDIPIQSGLLDKSLESAQKKVEAFYFDTRKQLFEYDQAINLQRDRFYSERRLIFEQKNLQILKKIGVHSFIKINFICYMI